MRTAASLATWIAALIVLAASGPGEAAPPSNILTLVTASEAGERLTVHGQVVDSSGNPISGAQLRVYQTDASGRYTRERAMDEAHARLSGSLRSDARGRFELRTIRPGGYPQAVRLGDKERKIPAHIHVDVTAAGHASHKLQVVFADDPLLADPYWRDWAKEGRHPVVAVTRDGSAWVARLMVTLETPLDRHVGAAPTAGP